MVMVITRDGRKSYRLNLKYYSGMSAGTKENHDKSQ
jgi:hypothetical protein